MSLDLPLATLPDYQSDRVQASKPHRKSAAAGSMNNRDGARSAAGSMAVSAAHANKPY